MWSAVTPKNKKVRRWFYIDIRKALDPSIDREEAIVGVPEDKIERSDFGRKIDRDLSTPEKEYACLMYPVCELTTGSPDTLSPYDEMSLQMAQAPLA
jgi:hypothetical protein